MAGVLQGYKVLHGEASKLPARGMFSRGAVEEVKAEYKKAYRIDVSGYKSLPGPAKVGRRLVSGEPRLSS